MKTPAPIRIAVVDDHPIVVAGLTAMFAKDEGIHLYATAANLAELTRKLRASVDVLLLDLNIPGEQYADSVSMAKRRWPRTRVAAYTSYGGADLVREMMSLGCDGYLLKNDTPEVMREGIRAIAAGERHVSLERRVASRRIPKPPVRRLRDDFEKGLLLSKREKEVLFHISKGQTSQQIADELFISRYTVETHRKNILRKLGFGSSTELVKFAVQQGLV